MNLSDSRGSSPASEAAPLSDPAPGLSILAAGVVFLLYAYELFNFSLSIDEELHAFDAGVWLVWIAQRRWGMGALVRFFPSMASIPMLATVVFCVGLAGSGYILARALFRDHWAQRSFICVFVTFPIWPHVGEFNTLSWGVGIGCLLVVGAFLLLLHERNSALVGATALLALATGIYQALYPLFLMVACLRFLSVSLRIVPSVQRERNRVRWGLRCVGVAIGGLVAYTVMDRLALLATSMHPTYVDNWVRLDVFLASPSWALRRCWNLVSGSDPIYLGYGRLLVLVPALGACVTIVRLVRVIGVPAWERVIAIGTLMAACALALLPVLMSAGTIPVRALIAWPLLGGFLAGLFGCAIRRFSTVLTLTMGTIVLVSTWLTVSLFYADHLARQRDQLLVARILAIVDRISPSAPSPTISFVIVGALAPPPDGVFRRVEIFGTSFFEHHGGDPWRVAHYLRLLGVDQLQPAPISAASADLPVIEKMPTWPAAGSVAVVNGRIVLKFGRLTSRQEEILQGRE